jgi:hypothetical protein
VLRTEVVKVFRGLQKGDGAVACSASGALVYPFQHRGDALASRQLLTESLFAEAPRDDLRLMAAPLARPLPVLQSREPWRRFFQKSRAEAARRRKKARQRRALERGGGA